MDLTLLKFQFRSRDFINIFGSYTLLYLVKWARFVLCVQLFELDFVSAVNLCMPPFDLFKSVDSFISYK